MTSLKGQLLIAAPALTDPNFLRTVVLITEHSDEGAMGLVLNRPTPVAVMDIAPELEGLAGRGALVSVGGPVQTSSIMVLAEFVDPDEAAALVFDSVGFVSAESDPVLVASCLRSARVFAGYSGWGAEQLESELEQGSWIVEPAQLEDVFPAEAEALWMTALRRKGGRYAVLSFLPLDPSVN